MRIVLVAVLVLVGSVILPPFLFAFELTPFLELVGGFPGIGLFDIFSLLLLVDQFAVVSPHLLSLQLSHFVSFSGFIHPP